MKLRLLILWLGILFISCDNLFEYSPYQVVADGLRKNRNETAIQQLHAKSDSVFKPFKIALISDNHTYYDDLEDQIEELNHTDSIDFVVHLGDFTLSGIYREFVWFGNLIDQLRKPVITIIGNHDCLSNGEYMYTELFGDFNFALIYNNCRLVFFDDIIWERNRKDPDFEWLEQTLEHGEQYNMQIVFAHIPPWDEQFHTGNSYLYNYIMESHQVAISIHGHRHSFRYEKRYGNIPYLVIGDSKDREIVILEVKQNEIRIDRRFL